MLSKMRTLNTIQKWTTLSMTEMQKLTILAKLETSLDTTSRGKLGDGDF